jgi:hypothetical protein
LKRHEEEGKILKGKYEELERKWRTAELEAKQSNDVAEVQAKQIKGLSQNALGLAKKVFICEDKLVSLEEHWLKR